ncbi:MAG: glycosyltransferase [Akkermansia sp.]|nr:glycosyltransferase [Akkermansia sp.]
MSDTAAPEPLVSVVIPVYNAEKYLRETLDCVCNQTLRNIEIICVDDGSTDSSQDILQEYAARDPRFRILHQQNQYAGVARNNGMAAARGKYLSFLDADDLFEPDMLEKMSARAEETGAEMVCCDVDCFTDNQQRLHPMYRLVHELAPRVPEVFCPAEALGKRLFQHFNPAPWNKLFLASFAREGGRGWLDTQYSNDLSFVLHCLFSCRRMALIDAALVHYRERSNSISHARRRDTAVFFRAWGDLRARLVQDNAKDEIMLSFANVFLGHLEWFLGSLAIDSKEKLLQEYEERYDRQGFHILELPDEQFEDPAKRDRMRGLFQPQLSVVVPFEKDPAAAERILRSSCSPDYCGYELVYCCPAPDAAYGEMLGRCARHCPQLRVFRGTETDARGFCRAPRIGVLPHGCKLAPNAGPALDRLCRQAEGTVDLAPLCVRQSRRELFLRYRADRKSWCLFGRPFLTVMYSAGSREFWLFGHRVAFFG